MHFIILTSLPCGLNFLPEPIPDDLPHGADTVGAGLLVCETEALELLGLGLQVAEEGVGGGQNPGGLLEHPSGLGVELVVLRELVHHDGQAVNVGRGAVRGGGADVLLLAPAVSQAPSAS